MTGERKGGKQEVKKRFLCVRKQRMREEGRGRVWKEKVRVANGGVSVSGQLDG